MSEKILIICSVLDVTPYELLGGTDGIGSRSSPSEYVLVTKDSEYGRTLMQFLELEKGMQGRLLGYMQALSEIQREHWYRVPLRCDYRCYIIIKSGGEGKAVDSLDIM